MVGYVMICYGICDAIFSVSFSPLVKVVGRVPIFLLGCAANVAIIILFFLWVPNPDDIAVFFIAAALWGLADAVWQTQINGEKKMALMCVAAVTSVHHATETCAC